MREESAERPSGPELISYWQVERLPEIGIDLGLHDINSDGQNEPPFFEVARRRALGEGILSPVLAFQGEAMSPIGDLCAPVILASEIDEDPWFETVTEYLVSFGTGEATVYRLYLINEALHQILPTARREDTDDEGDGGQEVDVPSNPWDWSPSGRRVPVLS